MTPEKIDNNSKIPSKALYKMSELIDLQSTRINKMEQQFLSLASRVSSIEGPNSKVRSF